MEARDPAERKSPVRVGKPRSTGDKASPSRDIRELPRLRRKSRKARESEWFVEWKGGGREGKVWKRGSPEKRRNVKMAGDGLRRRRRRRRNGRPLPPNLSSQEGFHLCLIVPDRNRWDAINLPLREGVAIPIVLLYILISSGGTGQILRRLRVEAKRYPTDCSSVLSQRPYVYAFLLPVSSYIYVFREGESH